MLSLNYLRTQSDESFSKAALYKWLKSPSKYRNGYSLPPLVLRSELIGCVGNTESDYKISILAPPGEQTAGLDNRDQAHYYFLCRISRNKNYKHIFPLEQKI